MASLTIDELKKNLTEMGVDLPTGRTRKEDYVKLYEDHIAQNAPHSSRDESSQSSLKVTSTNGENSSQATYDAIESLSNDELYEKLKELGYNAGPVLNTTRRVYERKLVQIVRGEHSGSSINGPSTDHQLDTSVGINSPEIFDAGMNIGRTVARNSQERNLTPQPSTAKRSVSREPAGASREPSVPLEQRRVIGEPLIPRRISYIETIARGSSQRTFEPVGTYLDDSALRQRPSAGGDRYIGSWAPNTSQYNQPLQKSNNKGPSTQKWIVLAVFVIILVALLAYVVAEWSATDPYKLLEEDAENVARKVDA